MSQSEDQDGILWMRKIGHRVHAKITEYYVKDICIMKSCICYLANSKISIPKYQLQLFNQLGINTNHSILINVLEKLNAMF